MKKRLLPHIAFGLFGVQLLLMLSSWIYSAAYPGSGLHSLLSSGGLRWLLGRFTTELATPVLVWLVLLSMSYGCVMRSHLFLYERTYRASRARFITLLLLFVYVGVMLLLTAMPHAVLLSATGLLWPSPFSASLIPVVSFGLVLLSAVYGLVAGTFNNLSEVYDALVDGLRSGAPLMLIYVLAAQVYSSLIYVFS